MKTVKLLPRQQSYLLYLVKEEIAQIKRTKKLHVQKEDSELDQDLGMALSIEQALLAKEYKTDELFDLQKFEKQQEGIEDLLSHFKTDHAQGIIDELMQLALDQDETPFSQRQLSNMLFTLNKMKELWTISRQQLALE